MVPTTPSELGDRLILVQRLIKFWSNPCFTKDFTASALPLPTSGVLNIGRLGQPGFFVKVASRLVPGEGRDLIVGDHKRDFRTFQKELATTGTKNFANG